GYGADDLDIAMLIFRLGGHQLLFALNHKLSLPSLCTLHLKSSFASLMSTISPIRNDQFDHNIQTIIVNTYAASAPFIRKMCYGYIAVYSTIQHYSMLYRVHRAIVHITKCPIVWASYSNK
ncbi:hypothetical protein BDR07DRAFT_1299509, partial [Suillus spraguei]